MQALPTGGAMASIGASGEAVLEFIASLGIGSRLSLAGLNTPVQTVVSGEAGAVDEIIAKAEEAARGEKDKMHADLKREFGRLVSNCTAQVTGKVLNDDDQQRINEEAMAEVES